MEKIKAFGGEWEISSDDGYSAIFASGRSSLRVILHNLPRGIEEIFLPAYICEDVLRTIQDYKLKVTFYSISTDLQPLIGPINPQKQVLYVCNHFGHHYVDIPVNPEVTVIYDAVFEVELDNYLRVKNFFIFNSLRKISPSVDGSTLFSNKPFKTPHHDLQNSFADLRSSARRKRAIFFETGNEAIEADFLNEVKTSEQALFDSKKHQPYSGLHFNLLTKWFTNYKKNKVNRLEKYQFLTEQLTGKYLQFKPKFPSFFIAKHSRREELLKLLTKKRIYLPIHWRIPSELYQRRNPAPEYLDISNLLSIPLDERYSLSDLETVAKYIKDL